MSGSSAVAAFVDITSSLASLVAIFAAMIGWYLSARRPLKVTGVVVHRSANDLTFIVVVKNRKDYPVVVSEIDCYSQKTYEVRKKRGMKPVRNVYFPGSHQIFRHRQSHEVLPNGHTDLRATRQGVLPIPKRLLLLMKTSHGYQELWCRRIQVVDIGKVTLTSLEGKYEYASAWRARLRYLAELIRSICS